MTKEHDGTPSIARRLRTEALRRAGVTERDLRGRSIRPEPDAAPAPEREEVTLFNEAARLFSHFYLDLGSDGPGAAVQFMSPHRGAGTSSVAREFACTAALHATRPILLLDLDFRADAQYDHFASTRRRYIWGDAQPGPEEDIGVDFNQLLRLSSSVPGIAAGEPVMITHRIGRTSLFVTRLHPVLRANKISPHITTAPAFWKELRRKVALTVIDAQPVHASSDGLALSRLVDQVILVVEAESTRIPVIQELCSRLSALDARIAGIVLNKRNFYIPQFLYRWI